MRWRVVQGPHTTDPIAVYRVLPLKIECRGLVYWYVPQLLEFLGNYWGGDCNPQATPQKIIEENLFS